MQAEIGFRIPCPLTKALDPPNKTTHLVYDLAGRRLEAFDHPNYVLYISTPFFAVLVILKLDLVESIQEAKAQCSVSSDHEFSGGGYSRAKGGVLVLDRQEIS